MLETGNRKLETELLSNDCKTERAKKPAEAKPLELAKVREALTNATGPTYWRSLEELSNTEGFQEMLHREFPRQASEWTDDFSRRNFLKVMGASLALAGLSACTKQPIEHILPYVRQPEEEVPGKPLYYATVMSFAGRSVPVLVKSNEGRPIKIEGNPDHPAGQEGSDIFSQASILDMYDPDRSQNVLLNNDGSSWGSFLGGIRGPLTSQKGMQGGGLRFLTGAVTSPTLASQLNGILKLYPKAKWHKYEPLPHDGQTAAFGQPVSVQHNFEWKHFWQRCLDQRAGKRSAIASRRQHCARRAASIGGCPLARLRHEPGARQCRQDHHLFGGGGLQPAQPSR